MRSILVASLFCLIALPAAAQEMMTFGHESPQPAQTQRQIYRRTKVPHGSTVIIKNPYECNPPVAYIGQSIQTLNNKRINKPVRIVRPGDTMLLDHNPQRLNFILDDGDIIRNIMCG